MSRHPSGEFTCRQNSKRGKIVLAYGAAVAVLAESRSRALGVLTLCACLLQDCSCMSLPPTQMTAHN
jgi:hypothetical protein